MASSPNVRLKQPMGRPSQQQFEHWLDSGFITNCSLTSADAKRTHIIYGPDIATIKGKTSKQKGAHVPLARHILVDHGDVSLCMDIFFVNQNASFRTISNKLQFCTVVAIDD